MRFRQPHKFWAFFRGDCFAVLSLVVVLAQLGGCGALRRNSVPQGKESEAQVAGFTDIRTWGRHDNALIREWLDERVKREREFEGIAEGTALPGEAYLAISGGGQDGAYGAGMLCGWTDRGDRPHFRIVTGVSAGALIAPFVFAGSEYDSVLREIFTSVHTKDIARSRNLLSALTGEALYDSDPLRDMLKKHVNEAMLAKVAAEYRKGRNLFVATTNLDAQRPVIWALGKIAASGHPDAPQLFREVMLASASIPGVFPPVYVETQVGDDTYEEMHVDGGATSQVFLYPPTFDFRAFASEAGGIEDRTVYVIRNSASSAAYQPVSRKTLDIARTAVSSLIRTQGEGDLYRIYLECLRDDITFQLATIPAEGFSQPEEMFDPKYMIQLFNRGYELARNGYPWSTAPPGLRSQQDELEAKAQSQE